MEQRNDISKLGGSIPVILEDYSCGCWGKHQPPYIRDDQIVIETGQGYRSNKHLHGQNLYVIEVDAANRIALIEMRKYGDMYGAGLWHYLVGMDGAPFVAQVSGKIDTLAEAMESLKPAVVKRAEGTGLAVQRQGDWYFVPVARTPRGEVETNAALDDDHIADEAIILRTTVYVRGTVSHSQHASLYLEIWHKAVQNNAIRTGRLARGGGTD